MTAGGLLEIPVDAMVAFVSTGAAVAVLHDGEDDLNFRVVVVERGERGQA